MDDMKARHALLSAALMLRYFTLEDIATHAGATQDCAREVLVGHPEWFEVGDPNDGQVLAPKEARSWRLRGDKVTEVTVAAEQKWPSSSIVSPSVEVGVGVVAEQATPPVPRPFDLLAMTRSLVDAATTWSVDDAGRLKTDSEASVPSKQKLLRTANLYMGRLQADLWQRQARAQERMSLDVAEVISLRRRLRAIQHEASPDSPSEAPLAFGSSIEISLRKALYDWTLPFLAPPAEQLPALPDGDMDSGIRWLLGDLGLHSSPFLPAARALQLKDALSTSTYDGLRSRSLQSCRQILSIPAASVVLPAISVLAAVLGAVELAPPILAALVAEEEAASLSSAAVAAGLVPLTTESRSIVYASLARLAPIRAEGSNRPASAAAACLYLVSRGCSDAEFAVLAPGALYGVTSDGVALLRRLVATFHSMHARSTDPTFSQAGALSRTLAIAMFEFKDPLLIGGELPRQLEQDHGKSFMETMTNPSHGAISLIDDDNGFLLRPGTSVRSTVPDRTISLAVPQHSAAADTLSWMITAAAQASRHEQANNSFMGRLRLRGGPLAFGGSSHGRTTRHNP